MSLLLILNIILTIFSVCIAYLNIKVLTGTSPSDYDTISIEWIINFYTYFFETIKRCCQVHVQATSLLKRNKHWITFKLWLHEKQLGSLRGISHSPGCCWYVKSPLFFFMFIWSRGRRAYRDLAFPNKIRWTKFNIDTSGSLWRRKLCEFRCTNLN